MCALALLAAALLPAFAQDPKEAVLGAQMAREIRNQSGVVTDPAIRLYVSQLATKLAGPNLPLTLEILDSRNSDDSMEPVWLPGNYIFVPTALLRNARDESEFAGMLAHTLAHQVNHDSLRMRTAGTPGTIPLVSMGVETGSPFEPMGSAARRRPFEREADEFAVTALNTTGYDPAGFARYISRIHPQDQERIDFIGQAISKLPSRPDAIVDTSDFRRIHEKVTPAEPLRTAPTLIP